MAESCYQFDSESIIEEPSLIIELSLEHKMSVRAVVVAQFEQVAREQSRKLARLTDRLSLLESGLDSLSFALIVARLEDVLGYDPFDSVQSLKFPVTFGDFVSLYEPHAK